LGGESNIATAAWYVVNSNLPKHIPQSFTVLADGTGDYPDIATALAALPNTGGVITLGTGTFVVNSSISNTTTSNVIIQGQGRGQTIISSSITTDNAIFDFEGTTSGNSLPLTANTVKGSDQVTLSTANAATLASGNYVLLRSNKIWDSSLNTKTGEILKVLSVNTNTGVVTLVDPVNDSYNTSDSASVIQITPLSNILFRDLTITSSTGSSSRTGGSLFFRFVSDLVFDNVETSMLWWAAMQLSSCWRVRLDNVYIHDMQDPAGASAQTHHGIVLNAATRDLALDDSSIVVTSNSVYAYGMTGTNFEGVVREIVINNTTSRGACTAHFNFGQSSEIIEFSNCTTIGEGPNVLTAGAPGFSVQGPQSVIQNCNVLRTPGRGIYLGGQASGAIVSGNQIEGVIAAGNPGDGIYLDTSITSVNINGNRIQDCAGHAITGNTGNNNLLIQTNEIINNAATDAAILLNGTHIILKGNMITTNAAPCKMTGSAESWTIMANDFSGNTSNAPILIGTASLVNNNMGYNPVGSMTTPIPSSGTNIFNVNGSSTTPASGTTYTNRYTTKSVVLSTASTTTNLIIDNSTMTGVSSTLWTFVLSPGESFSTTYTGGTPIVKMFCH
jgi:Right handed beta helix region/Pectinesterase